MRTPYDGSIEATYADGYIHSETNLDDVSPYTGIHNVLNDILEKRPEPEHGALIRFTVYYKNTRYDIDWHGLPDNARPIRYKRMEASTVDGVLGIPTITTLGFGYQYTDSDGKNVQEVTEL